MWLENLNHSMGIVWTVGGQRLGGSTQNKISDRSECENDVGKKD